MASTPIFFIYLTLFLSIACIANSTKVIYINLKPEVHSGGIIIAPPEKIQCKDNRTPDRSQRCRRIIEF